MQTGLYKQCFNFVLTFFNLPLEQACNPFFPDNKDCSTKKTLVFSVGKDVFLAAKFIVKLKSYFYDVYWIGDWKTKN